MVCEGSSIACAYLGMELELNKVSDTGLDILR